MSFIRSNEMKYLILILTLVSFNCVADYKVSGNKIIPTDSYGNRQWGETNYKIEGNKMIPTDSYGNRKWNSTNYKTESNGKVIPTDSYGNRKYN